MQDTIFALATGAGRAAVAIIRISGPNTKQLLKTLCGSVPLPRMGQLRRLRSPSGDPLDRGIVFWTPGPNSYTGENCAELHIHGGHAVIDSVADALISQGARPAEAGEFTRRAFLNGKLDLTEAEGVADLIDAETSAQRRQALQQLEGGLSRLLTGWTERLTKLLAWQETLIDFPDEDLPSDVEASLLADMQSLREAMQKTAQDGAGAEKLRDGLVFTILGRPNAGKSSLLNVLAERDAAIVSPQAGTTRDTIEVRVILGGVPVTLIDTAGLRESTDSIEAEGIRRALARAESADLVVRVIDLSAPPLATPENELWPGALSAPTVIVGTKSDLPHTLLPPGDGIAVSTYTGDGLSALKQRLGEEAKRLTSHTAGAPLTRARHRAALQQAIDHLDAARNTSLVELRAEEIRLALQAVSRITGKVGVEEILDHIFLSFCIGK